MADRKEVTPSAEPLTDLQFMERARAVLDPLDPLSRAIVLYMVKAAEDDADESFGDTLERAFEVMGLAASLKDRADLEPSLKWLRGQLDVARINIVRGDTGGRRRGR